MEHPNKEQKENQAKFLEQLPEDQREYHAQLFRFGNAAYIYHRLATGETEPTEEDFNEWLVGLPSNIRRDMETKGFELCKGILSFTRYVNEKNDVGMEEWMKRNLSGADYRSYCETGDKARE